MVIFLAILIFAAMVIVPNMTGDPDDILWVLLGAPVVIPLSFAVFWTVIRLVRSLATSTKK